MRLLNYTLITLNEKVPLGPDFPFKSYICLKLEPESIYQSSPVENKKNLGKGNASFLFKQTCKVKSSFAGNISTTFTQERNLKC